MAKIKRNITIDEDVWNNLPKYITCSRSAFFEQQAIKQINSFDDIERIELKLKMLESNRKKLELDEKDLKAQRKFIIEQREKNKNDFEIREKAMHTIRKVVDNEGAIELSRIKFIANNHILDFHVLVEKCESENIKIIDRN